MGVYSQTGKCNVHKLFGDIAGVIIYKVHVAWHFLLVQSNYG